MGYVNRVAIGFAIFAVFVGYQRWVGHQAAETFNNMPECEGKRDMPFEVCIVPEWRKLNAEIDAMYDKKLQLYAGQSDIRATLKSAQHELLAVRMYRPILDGGDPDHVPSREEIEKTLHPSPLQTAAFVAKAQESAEEPGTRMRRHLSFLKSLSQPREGVSGKWANAGGYLHIGTQLFGKDLVARVKVTDPKTFATLCEAAMPLAKDGVPGDPSLAYMQVRKSGGVLEVNLENPDRVGCDEAHAIEGSYLPAS